MDLPGQYELNWCLYFQAPTSKYLEFALSATKVYGLFLSFIHVKVFCKETEEDCIVFQG